MSLYKALKQVVPATEQSPACRLAKAIVSLYTSGRHDAPLLLYAGYSRRNDQVYKVSEGCCHLADHLIVIMLENDAQALLNLDCHTPEG